MNIPLLTTVNKVSARSTTRVISITILVAISSAVAAIMVTNHAKAGDQAEMLNALGGQQAGIRQEAGEYWENSSQTFLLDADGRFSIDNVSGQIEIQGWNNNAVVLVTAIHGKTREGVEAVKINIDSDSNHIAIHTEQQSNVTVDYAAQVPEHALLKGVSSVNGHIVINGVAGDIAASTVNGGAQIKDACHNLKLETVNGNITAEMNLLGSGQSASFNTVNGQIKLALPENTDAKFSMNTLNGDITSEFPSLQAKKEFPVGNELKGRLGQGSASVKAYTVNGGIKILKRAPASPASNPAPASLPFK
jgi:hypothetical protein